MFILMHVHEGPQYHIRQDHLGREHGVSRLGAERAAADAPRRSVQLREVRTEPPRQRRAVGCGRAVPGQRLPALQSRSARDPGRRGQRRYRDQRVRDESVQDRTRQHQGEHEDPGEGHPARALQPSGRLLQPLRDRPQHPSALPSSTISIRRRSSRIIS